jgi:hypothetical protein
VIAVAGSVLALGGCLGCGKTFSAQGFVDEANSKGAGLELGRELPTGQSGKETYAVELARKEDDPVLPGVEAESEGSMTVYDDTGAANEGTAECEAGADLLCYQAGNVVLVFESGAPNISQTRLATAITEMGD